MKEYDYALVEDKNRGEGKNPVVACVSLHRHEGYYGSVNLTFGHPELIATDPVWNFFFCSRDRPNGYLTY